MTSGNEVESGQGDARAQQETAQEQKRRTFARSSLAHRPPEAAEEGRAEADAFDPGNDLQAWPGASVAWKPLLPRTKVRAHTRHMFVLKGASAVTHYQLIHDPAQLTGRLPGAESMKPSEHED